MIKTIIAGAGGFGLEVLEIIRDIGGYDVVGFLDADPEKKGTELRNIPVLGGDDRLLALRDDGIVAIAVAIGAGRVRQHLLRKVQEFHYDIPALIHPRAYIASDVVIGPGTIVYPGAVIMPGCKLGEGVLINGGAVLGHDVMVGSYSNINPGVSIAGRVNIGERVLVGIGSTILENCSIGDDARIGAGAAVIEDVSKEITVVGVPAKPTRKSHW